MQASCCPVRARVWRRLAARSPLLLRRERLRDVRRVGPAARAVLRPCRTASVACAARAAGAAGADGRLRSHRLARRVRRARRRVGASSCCATGRFRWLARLRVRARGAAARGHRERTVLAADGHDPLGQRLQPDGGERSPSDLAPWRRLHAAVSPSSASGPATFRRRKARCRPSPPASSSASACGGTPPTAASSRSAPSSVLSDSCVFVTLIASAFGALRRVGRDRPAARRPTDAVRCRADPGADWRRSSALSSARASSRWRTRKCCTP